MSNYEIGYEYKVKGSWQKYGDYAAGGYNGFEVEAVVSKKKKKSVNLPSKIYNESWPSTLKCDDLQ